MAKAVQRKTEVDRTAALEAIVLDLVEVLRTSGPYEYSLRNVWEKLGKLKESQDPVGEEHDEAKV